MIGESRDFEYDGEDIETDEYAYEADEADESDEMLEADGEAEYVEADEAVESDEASDESVWEADEAVDESDGEADEALDEAAVSASARLRASRDKNRRAAWARRIAADQRVEQKRSASTQRSLTRRIQSIPSAPAPKVASVGPLRGAGVVKLTLPNGRSSQARIQPALAPIREVNRLRQVISANDRRQAVAMSRTSNAVRALAVTQAQAIKKLSAEQVKSDKELRKRLVEGDNRLDQRITKELTGGTGVLDKHGKGMMAQLKRQRQRQMWNNVLLATSAPFFAAYGERGNPFSYNNLVLTGSLMFWMLGDEAIDMIGSKSSIAKGGANWWSYLAFAGNAGTSYWLLKDRQHERFISGITTVVGPGTKTVSLTKGAIGKSSIDAFKGSNHTVVATLPSDASAANTVYAVVDGENLLLTVEPALAANAQTTVAWIVDTQPENEVKVEAAT